MFIHYIDILPFLLATILLVFGASKVDRYNPITYVIILATGVYLIAQSSWFTSYMSGDEWGRAFSNYIWFLFNTLSLSIFAWILIYKVE